MAIGSKDLAVTVDQNLHIVHGWEPAQARGVDIHLVIIESNGRFVGVGKELPANYLIPFIIELAAQLDHIAVNGRGIGGSIV